MSFFEDKRKRRIFIFLVSIALAIAVTVGACVIYLSDYYRADEKAIATFLESGGDEDGKVTEKILEDDTRVYIPEYPTDKGFIFYPGGKVEYTAYIPLMEACASRGILCVLLEMPFNLAVLDVNAADGIRELYPHIEDWYIGGHSLGGSMAASYLGKHTKEFEGLVLLGSYSTADLSDSDIGALSVYGSEDGVMNKEKYEKNKPNLPQGFSEFVIDGGCHAYFGMYGEQEGDGTPTLTPAKQIEITADAIDTFVREK